MTEIFSFGEHKLEKQCRFQPLKTLFERHPIVLVGDELGAFYLDKRVFPTDDCNDHSNDNDAFFLWDKRNQYETKVSYMELVHAAYAAGARDIVIDMVPAMQPGLDEALKTYRETSIQFTTEILFRALLMNDTASPMDAVVQMAGALGMKVHALNTGLTGMATLFRVAPGTKNVPQNFSHEERIKHYKANGFEKDKEILRQLVRRHPTEVEFDTMRQYMEMRLGDKKEEFEEKVFDETPTQKKIQATLGDKPFLGFFQNARLFQSTADLDEKLREAYGEQNVARLSLIPVEDMPKPAQYQFRYSRKNCAVAMTKEYVRVQRVVDVNVFRPTPVSENTIPAAPFNREPANAEGRMI